MRYTLFFALFALCSLGFAAAEPVTLSFRAPQTAGISGFLTFWDTPVILGEDGKTEVIDHGYSGMGPSAIWNPAKRENGMKPGALVFDAVHRSLLVRFPGAAEQIAMQVNAGFAIRKVELLLPFKDTEFWPEGYDDPSGMSFLGTQWKDNPPQWHAVAWALRKPWVADPKLGPTYNAYLNGTGYWAKYGAQDTEHDRYPTRFGPVAVSYKHPEGRLDLTALLTDATYGASLATRLRALEDNGLLVRKEEYYDARYLTGGYEWGTSTGGRGILIHSPVLVPHS